MDQLTEPKFAHNAIDELVLRPEKNKDVIKAIVRTYTEEDLFSVDFIRGKGEGQVFLLHGPPGTGKTLTAGKRYVSGNFWLRSLLKVKQSLLLSIQSDRY